MVCYAARYNQLKSAGGNSGESSSCVTTLAGFFIGDNMARPITRIKTACIECREDFDIHLCNKKRGRRFCSPKCYYDSLRGKKKPTKPIGEHRWLLSEKGYLVTTVRGKRVFQHRWIIETQVIKRKLLKSEIVHHYNGVKADNRHENLVVCTRQTHAEYISKLNNRIKELESRQY